MDPSFMVYVDESGDEGFKFKNDDGSIGSSEWFILSAVVIRTTNDRAIIEALASARTTLGKGQNFALHFRHLTHEQRIPYITTLSMLPMRLVTVLVHKPTLTEPETFSGYRLYHYGVRFLLERVSWLCRDSYQKSAGDGSAKIIFSNRSSMSYDDLRGYVKKLVEGTGPLDVRIESNVIKPDQILARPHHQLAGLQAADAVASSFYFAAQTHRLGFTEPRYIQILSRAVYRHDKIAIGYGVKFWPKECDSKVAELPTLSWAKELFEKK